MHPFVIGQLPTPRLAQKGVTTRVYLLEADHLLHLSMNQTLGRAPARYKLLGATSQLERDGIREVAKSFTLYQSGSMIVDKGCTTSDTKHMTSLD